MRVTILGILGVGGVEVADKAITTSVEVAGNALTTAQTVVGFTPDQLIKYAIQLAIGLFTVYIQNRYSRGKRTKNTKSNQSGNQGN